MISEVHKNDTYKKIESFMNKYLPFGDFGTYIARHDGSIKHYNCLTRCLGVCGVLIMIPFVIYPFFQFGSILDW